MKKATSEYSTRLALENYLATAYTSHFIMGCDENGKVNAYLVELNIDSLCLLFSDKPTTAKRQTIIKYRSTRAKQNWLKKNAIYSFELCSTDELKASCRVKTNRKGEPYTENCGECFEWLLAKRFGIEQNEKANLSHKDGGDLVINGIAYQVKYERAGIAVELG